VGSIVTKLKDCSRDGEDVDGTAKLISNSIVGKLDSIKVILMALSLIELGLS
jgi:hypothetical protein